MSKYILITNYIDGNIRDRREFLLSSVCPEITVGRSTECNYIILGWGEQGQGISRKHCTLSLCGDVVTIADGDGSKQSRWGTYWGRKRLDQGEAVALLPEDEERVIIAIAPHQITAKVSSDRMLSDVEAQEDTVRTNIYVSQLEMRIEELERRVEVLERSSAG